MPKITCDYHTHTVMSHGRDTARDNIEAALRLGLGKIGIADHAPGHFSYGIREMELYLSELEKLREEYAGRIEVKAGIELSLCGLMGQVDMPEGCQGSFDVILLGLHRSARMADLRSYLHFCAPRSHAGARQIARTTGAYLAALEGQRIDILADPGHAAPIDLAEVAAACASQGTLFELNNAHDDLSEADIELAAKQGVKFVLSSGAHESAEVGRVDGALAKAQSVGLGPAEIQNLAP